MEKCSQWFLWNTYRRALHSCIVSNPLHNWRLSVSFLVTHTGRHGCIVPSMNIHVYILHHSLYESEMVAHDIERLIPNITVSCYHGIHEIEAVISDRALIWVVWEPKDEQQRTCVRRLKSKYPHSSVFTIKSTNKELVLINNINRVVKSLSWFSYK